MKLLALDCSATAASCAVLEEDRVIASSFVNVKLTHSETLLPMLQNTLSAAKLSLNDIGAFAINNGPGSFTGIRIGISAVKGLALPNNLPCVAVSTLYSIAELHKNLNGIIVAVMDARCNQVYNAIFKIENGNIWRLCEDRAVLISQVITQLEKMDDNIFIAGDGAHLFSEYANGKEKVNISKEPLLYQNAVGVGLAANEMLTRGQTVTANELCPLYLRLPQAERELKVKKGETL